MGNKRISVGKFGCILLILVLFLSGCQSIRISEGNQLKLIKYADSYIKGEYIGMIEASISLKNKKANPSDFPEPNVVNSYPLLISEDTLILAKDVTLQNAVIRKQMPGKIISYMISNGGLLDDKNIKKIFLICKGNKINSLFSLYIVTKIKDTYVVPDNIYVSFDTETTSNKIIACCNVHHNNHDLIVCQDTVNNIVYHYKEDGILYNSVNLVKPLLLLTQYESKEIEQDFIPLAFDGQNLILFKVFVDDKDPLSDYALPYSEIDRIFELPINTHINPSFMKPKFFLFFKDPMLSFTDGRRFLLFNPYTKNVQFNELYEYCVLSNNGLYQINNEICQVDYYNSELFSIFKIDADKSINCIGETFINSYYNVSIDNKHYLMSILKLPILNESLKEFVLQNSDYFDKPFDNYITGYTYDLLDDYGLKRTDCIFTDDEVYILLDN